MKLHLAPHAGWLAATLFSLPAAAQTCDRIPISSLPFSITSSGSYYLTQTLVSAGQNITVFASDVTIDLNGFALLGAGAPTNAIVAPVIVRNLEVRNGVVAGWGSSGILLGNAPGTRLAGLRLSNNGAFGVHNASACVIEDCTVIDNGQGGLDLLDTCTVRRCLVKGNQGLGIQTLRRATVEGCTIEGNAGGGVEVLENSLVQDNLVLANSATGIRVERQCRVLRNTLTSHATGIRVTSTRCEITDNLVTGSTLGIDVDGLRSLIGRNSLGANTTNFDVASGNLLGPLVTSGGFATNTNPNANYQL